MPIAKHVARDTVQGLRERLLESEKTAAANLARARREEQAGREAGNMIESLHEKVAAAQAESFGKDVEIRVLREMVDKLMARTIDVDRHGSVTIS